MQIGESRRFRLAPAFLVAATLLSLTPAVLGAGIDARSTCCGSDGVCRLYIAAGPDGSSYADLARSVQAVLQDHSWQGNSLSVTVLLNKHGDGKPLIGSVHNLFYLLHLASVARLEDFPPGEATAGSAGLVRDDVNYLRNCTLAIAQADAAYMTQAGVLQRELVREKWIEEIYRGPSGEEIDTLLSSPAALEEAICRDSRKKELGWLFSPEFHCRDRWPIGTQVRENPAFQLRALLSLGREPLHLVMRYPMAISSLQELGNFDVYVGPLGSGTRLTASNILNASGVKTDAFLASGAKAGDSFHYLESIRRIRRQELDAFFIVSTPPFRPIIPRDWYPQTSGGPFEDLLAGGRAYLHSLPTDAILKLTGLFPLYSTVEIPANSYPGQAEATNTIGVNVLLVATASFPADLGLFLVETLVLHEEELQAIAYESGKFPIPIDVGMAGYAPPAAGEDRAHVFGTEIGAGVAPDLGTGRYSIPYHQGTSTFMEGGRSEAVGGLGWREQAKLAASRVWYQLLYRYDDKVHIGLLLLFMALAMAVPLCWPRTRVGLIRLVNAHPFLSALLGMGLVLLFFGTLTFLSEHRRSDFFSNPAEAIFSVVVYLFSGFEDRAPVTFAGRLGSTVILFLSPLTIALFTGYVVRKTQQQLAVGYIIPRRLRNHFVICGWNDRALGVVLQLRDELLDKMGEKAPIVLVGHPDRYEVFEQIKDQYAEYMHDVRIVYQAPTDPLALYRARVARARAILVLAEGPNDGHASLVVAAIRTLAEGWEPETKAFHGRVWHRLLHTLAMFVLAYRHRLGQRPAASERSDALPGTSSGVRLRDKAERLRKKWSTRWSRPHVIVESVGAAGEVVPRPATAAVPAGREGTSHGRANASPLIELGRDRAFEGHFRILYAERIRSNAFAAAARNKHGGLVQALFELLTFGVRSNELYVVPVSVLYSTAHWRKLAHAVGDGDDGVPFFRLVSHAYRKTSARPRNPVMIVGVRAGPGEAFVTNPCGAKSNVYYDDELLAAAYRQPRIWRLKKWARMCKTFMSSATGTSGRRR